MATELDAELLMNPRSFATGPTDHKEIQLTEVDMFDLGNTDPGATPAGASGGSSSSSAPSAAPSSSASASASADASGYANFASESYAAPRRTMTADEIFREKRKKLDRLDRARRRGRHVSRNFTMDDSLEDIEREEAALKEHNRFEFMMEMGQNGLVLAGNTAEWVSATFPSLGLRLKGAGQAVTDNMTDFEGILEELIDEYASYFQFGPEMRLISTFGMTMYMTHVTNKMMGEFGPSARDVMKDNPALAQQFAAEMARRTQANMAASMSNARTAATATAPSPPMPMPTAPSGPPASAAGMMFVPPPISQGPPPQRKEMSGPSSSLLDSLNLRAPTPSAPTKVPAPPASIASVASHKSEKRSVVLNL